MAVSQLAPTELLDTYRSMVTIRRFEERVLELRRADVFAGSIHLCAGQEAVPVGALAALDRDDRVVATYRGHGWALACGVPLERLMAEVCQRATGVNGGRGGSAHLMAPEHGLLGENSIVGGGMPIAAGAALASQVTESGRVAAVSIGDGATSQGATHEALVFAAYRKLPLVVVCENNRWSEMTPIDRIVPVADLSARAAGLGIAGASVDGNDPIAVRDAVAEAAARARAGDGPTFIQARCHRLWAHYNGDAEHYRPAADRDAAQAADPVASLRDRLAEAGVAESELAALEREATDLVDAAAREAETAPGPDPETARDHVHGGPAAKADTGERSEERELTYGKAVNEALRRELAARPEVLVYGEDVGHAGGIFGVTRTLQEEFGERRVFDMPIAEAAILGSAVGAALEGLRPVVEIMWADFMLVALDQLINQAANVRYVSGGRHGAPLVVRSQQGADGAGGRGGRGRARRPRHRGHRRRPAVARAARRRGDRRRRRANEPGARGARGEPDGRIRCGDRGADRRTSLRGPRRAGAARGGPGRAHPPDPRAPGGAAAVGRLDRTGGGAIGRRGIEKEEEDGLRGVGEVADESPALSAARRPRHADGRGGS